MNKRMIKTLKNKYIYVDIDGTLAEYRFNNHVSAKDGTANGQTMEEIGNHVFVPEEYWDNFLEYFDHNNSLEYKLASNDTYIETKYGAIMKGSKTRIWDWIISHNLHKLEETVFIDDVLSYLKQAEEKGVTAYHISSFIE